MLEGFTTFEDGHRPTQFSTASIATIIKDPTVGSNDALVTLVTGQELLVKTWVLESAGFKV